MRSGQCLLQLLLLALSLAGCFLFSALQGPEGAAKKREILQKILYPNRFGKTKVGLSGKRRRIKLQPGKVKGDDAEGADEDV